MKLTRRNFFKGIGLSTLGLGFDLSVFNDICYSAEALTEDEKHTLLMKGTVSFKGFHAKEITPNDEFYITTYSSVVPRIVPNTLELRIEGFVEKPYRLTMDMMLQMQDKTEFVTLECIGNPIGGDAIGNALWEGVTLRKVLEKAQPKKGAVKTVFHAEDGYSDSIPYELSFSEDVLLAFRMNGQPLPEQHGYPLRVIVPGIYGMKHVKWVSRIEVVNYDYKGYWEMKGWSDQAVIPIKSQILMPMDGKNIPSGNYVIGGIAFAGRYGISKVQVSLDNGKAWQDAEIKDPLSKWVWVLWRYDWKPSRKGTYTIKVRGIDTSGKIQESTSFLGRFFKTFPDGAKGIHSVDVTVT